MGQILFCTILAILIVDFFLERFLGYLNSTKMSSQLPLELVGIYDVDKYQKQQNYERENYRFSLLTSSFSFILIILMLVFGGFAFVDNWLRSFTQNPILLGLLFFGLLLFLSDLFSTPFDLYDTFVIEQKYGFNKTTIKTYILDKLKGWLLAAIIGGLVLSVLIWFYLATREFFWIYSWVLVSVVMVFMSMFYSSLIVPLFNKQTPLDNGSLRDSIKSFSDKVGFKLDNIYVIDGSKRSTKANAYFSGLGSKKRIVLYDTLIQEMTTDEIVAVLAHEIGHYKKKHTLLSIILSIIQVGITFYLLSLFVSNTAMSNALGSDYPSFHLGLIAFGILYTPISTILSLLGNVISRKNEYAADRFAGEYFNPVFLIDALKKLSVRNLSNLTPHPWYVFFHYSHPPLLQRIKALTQISK